jgi:hypothetical protein
MRRPFRIALAVTSALVVLVLSLPLLAPLWAGPVVRRLMLPRLSAYLGRMVEVADVVGRHGRIELFGLVIKDPPGEGDQQPDVVVSKIELGYRVAPLWRLRLMINRLDVDGASFAIQGKLGQDSLTPIIDKLLAKREKGRTDKRVILVHDAHLHVEGNVKYRDDAGTQVTIRRLSFVSATEQTPGASSPRIFNLILDGIRAERSEAIAASVERITARINLDKRIPIEELNVDSPQAELNQKRILAALARRIGRAILRQRFRRMMEKPTAATDDE